MKRFVGLAGVLMVVVFTSSCGLFGGPVEDVELRGWVKDSLVPYLTEERAWLEGTVLPALKAYCELEQHVYDEYHPAPRPGTPVLVRYCDPSSGGGVSDPVPPPAGPPTWDD